MIQVRQLIGTVFCILIFLCISINAEAQLKKIKFGKFSDEFKAYKECEFSPGSGAVILQDNGESYFETTSDQYRTVKRYHKIIKILSKDGLDAGDIEFETTGKIITLKAKTYNEVNGKWLAMNFERSNLYKEKIKGSRDLTEYKIPMPNVKTGSIIELLVEIHYDGIFIPNWYFQDNLPTLSSSYTTFYPNDFIFTPKIKSYFRIKALPKRDISQTFLGKTLKATEYQYVAQNIPPLKTDEKFAPDPFEYASHIEFDLLEVRSDFLNNYQANYKDYKEFTAGLLGYSQFGGYLEKKSGLLKGLGVDITEKDDNNARAHKIYAAVQEKIEWDEYYSMYPGKSPSKTIKDGEGEVSDINMLLVAALREAGLKAYPLTSSTKANGVPGITRPDHYDFNYLLCALKSEKDDGYIILDASMKGLPFGMVPYYVLNKSGYLIDYVRYGWVNIQEPAEHEEIYVANLKIEDEQLQGTVMAKLDNYAAYDFYVAEDERQVKELKGDFKKRIAEGWEWNDIDFKEIVPKKAVTLKGEISKDAEVDDLIYIQPTIFKIFTENPFKEEDRTAPVDVPYQLKYRMLFNLQIPEGYAVEEIPNSNKMNLPEDGGEFTYLAEDKGGKVSVNITFHLRNQNYSTSSYPIIHAFFAQIHEQLENMIVLKKL